MNLRISSRAPTRIDLAGGTLDIWPLYLFLKNPITVNLGINLFAEVTLVQGSSATQGHVILKSVDQKLEIKLPWQAFATNESPTIPAGLELHYRLLRYFLEKKKTQDALDLTKDINKNLLISTNATSPSGAGLGGSSTLSIAMVGALSTWASATSINLEVNMENIQVLDPVQNGQSFIDVVRDVETTVIRVPAGLQDYYGAMYGGLQSLQWGTGTHHREHLPDTLIQELQDRILLFYSGKSRNSGINNWVLFKDFIDNKNEVRAKFEKISSATHYLRKSLLDQDWKEVGHAITQEWEARKTLSSEITTPEIDKAFAAAKELASISGKICGAGGGGCFFIYLPMEASEARTELKTKIEGLFAEQKMHRLDFHGVPRGLEIRVHRE
jgi:D-glycero-alpha-D-manno-heptose-7-phosphate kinase